MITLRHPNCKEQDCSVCMEDHMLLETELRSRCGGRKLDWLSKYHSFISKRLGRAETEWGWATPECFEEVNINAFVEDWNEIVKEKA